MIEATSYASQHYPTMGRIILLDGGELRVVLVNQDEQRIGMR